MKINKIIGDADEVAPLLGDVDKVKLERNSRTYAASKFFSDIIRRSGYIISGIVLLFPLVWLEFLSLSQPNYHIEDMDLFVSVAAVLLGVVGFGFIVFQENLRVKKYRKMAEAIKESAAQSIQAERLVKTGYYTFDIRDDHIVVCSNQHALSQGCSESACTKQCAAYNRGMSFIHPDDRDTLRAAYDKVAQGKPAKIEYRTLDEEGERRIQETIQPIFDENGEVFQKLGATLDVTERHQREQELTHSLQIAEEADIAKDNFLAAMSHDLRTPLNAIIGFSEVLEMGLVDPLANEQQLEYVGHIHSSAKHLHCLISDLLNVSKQGDVELNFQPKEINLFSPLEQICVEARQIAQKAGVTIVTDLPEVGPSILGDEECCYRIFSNVLGNAIKYTPEGGEVRVSVRQYSYMTDIIIEDTGPGFPSGDISHLLNPFVQEKPGNDGVGLGLSIVNTLMRFHQGTLILENRKEGGARVLLEFPLASPNRNANALAVA